MYTYMVNPNIFTTGASRWISRDICSRRPVKGSAAAAGSRVAWSQRTSRATASTSLEAGKGWKEFMEQNQLRYILDLTNLIQKLVKMWIQWCC